MVNLRSRANVLTSRINPNLSIGYRRYAGRTVNPDGTQVAEYDPQTPVVAQVQSLGKKEVDHLSSLRISNCERMVYVNFQLQATDRVAQTGGDRVRPVGAGHQHQRDRHGPEREQQSGRHRGFSFHPCQGS